MDLLGACNNCGAVFSAPNFIGIGPGVTDVSFQENSTNCPQCGATARLSDFHIDGQGKSLLTHFLPVLVRPNVTRSELSELLEFVRREKEKKASAIEVSQALEKEQPKFAGLKEHLSTSTDILTVLDFLSRLIIFIITYIRP